MCPPSFALTTCPALRTFFHGEKFEKTPVKSSSAGKPPVQGQHQKKCQRSAPQSAQKCVPQKASLLNSILGKNLEHAACHDYEELECRRSAPRSEERCAWETGLSALPPTVPLTAAQE